MKEHDSLKELTQKSREEIERTKRLEKEVLEDLLVHRGWRLLYGVGRVAKWLCILVILLCSRIIQSTFYMKLFSVIQVDQPLMFVAICFSSILGIDVATYFLIRYISKKE